MFKYNAPKRAHKWLGFIVTCGLALAPLGCNLEGSNSAKPKGDVHKADDTAQQPPAPNSSSLIHVEKNAGSSNDYTLEPREDADATKNFASLPLFLEKMASNPVYSKKFMRQFAGFIEQQGLDFYGFQFEAVQGTPCRFRVHASRALAAGQPRPTPLPTHYISMPYPDDNVFKVQYIDNATPDPKAAVRKSAHSTSFYTMRGGNAFLTKRLVVPNGPYVTIYNFAKKATATEITDFFQRILDDAAEFKFNSDPNIYSNAIEGQGVYHFHMHVTRW